MTAMSTRFSEVESESVKYRADVNTVRPKDISNGICFYGISGWGSGPVALMTLRRQHDSKPSRRAGTWFAR